RRPSKNPLRNFHRRRRAGDLLHCQSQNPFQVIETLFLSGHLHFPSFLVSSSSLSRSRALCSATPTAPVVIFSSAAISSFVSSPKYRGEKTSASRGASCRTASRTHWAS